MARQISFSIKDNISLRGEEFRKEYYTTFFLPVYLADTPVLIGIDMGVRMIYAACCRELTKNDTVIREIMNTCLKTVEDDDLDLTLSEEAMPDVRQYNRWCLSVNKAWPTLKPPGGYRDGSKEVMWALMMGIAHDRDSFFSLHRYQDANEWEYGEVLKRLRMMATLIYAERAQGRYIK